MLAVGSGHPGVEDRTRVCFADARVHGRAIWLDLSPHVPSTIPAATERRPQDRLPEIAAVSCGNAKIHSQNRIMIMLNGPAAIGAGPSDLRFQWGERGDSNPDTQDHNNAARQQKLRKPLVFRDS